MLLDRNAPGDRDKARTLLGEAIEMYQQIGMPRHHRVPTVRARVTRALLYRDPCVAAAACSSSRAPGRMFNTA